MGPFPDFHEDRKWCDTCGEYVPYLRSHLASYCSRCDGLVRLFSDVDRRAFEVGLRAMPRLVQPWEDPPRRESA